MKVLLDTNIIIRASQPTSPAWADINNAMGTLAAAGNELCLVPQVLYEFWVAVTRPVAQNGFGLDAQTAAERVEECLTQFNLLRDERGVFQHWYTLVQTYQVLGKVAHDSRLVAAMQRHSVTCLLTINKGDFARFQSVVALSPSEVLAGTLP